MQFSERKEFSERMNRIFNASQDSDEEEGDRASESCEVSKTLHL